MYGILIRQFLSFSLFFFSLFFFSERGRSLFLWMAFFLRPGSSSIVIYCIISLQVFMGCGLISSLFCTALLRERFPYLFFFFLFLFFFSFLFSSSLGFSLLG
jgi:hypothetical protein